MTYEDIKKFLDKVDKAIEKGELDCTVILSVAQNETCSLYSQVIYGEKERLMALNALNLKKSGVNIKVLDKSSDKKKNKSNLN